MGVEVRMPLSCPPPRARDLALAQLRRDGWRASAEQGSHVDRSTSAIRLERGSIGRSVLLGGLAGRRQHLVLRVEVRPQAHGSLVVCSWSETSPRALGGILGQRRAEREMRRTIEDLSRALGR